VNSLEELNDYSLTTMPFIDERPSAIVYDRPITTNQSITVIEGNTHPALTGIDIEEIVNCQSGNVVYRIDLRQANAQAIWSSLPANVTSNVSPMGVYNINGLTLTEDWDKVKSPNIVLPADYANTFAYTSTIYLNGNVSNYWVNTVTVTDLPEMTTPIGFYYTPGIEQTITNNPIVLDTSSDVHTITLTVNDTLAIGNLYVNGTMGGNLTSNATTKTITITGNNTSVNSHLGNIRYQNPTGVDSDWILTYSLNNPLSNLTTVRTQQITSLTATILSRGNVSYYTEDADNLISNTPLVTSGANASATYNLTISSILPNNISTLSAVASGGTASFNGTTKVLTISGTPSQINGRLANLRIIPYVDLTSDIQLNYTLPITLPNVGATQIDRIQTLVCNATNAESPANITVARTFVQNTPDYLFVNSVPEITEVAAGTPTYTISLVSTLGEFSLNDSFIPEAPGYSYYTYSGTKAQVNAIFSQLKFYPYKSVLGTGTMTYTQYRDGVQQLSQNIVISGTARTTPLPDAGTFIFNSGTYSINIGWLNSFTPTIYQARYLRKNIFVKGRGGLNPGDFAYANRVTYTDYQGSYYMVPPGGSIMPFSSGSGYRPYMIASPQPVVIAGNYPGPQLVSVFGLPGYSSGVGDPSQYFSSNVSIQQQVAFYQRTQPQNYVFGYVSLTFYE